MSKQASDRLTGANMCLSHSGLAAGTTNTVSTGALVISLNGRTYSVGAAANGAAITTDAVTGVAFLPLILNQVCTFVIGYDKALARKIVQGPVSGDLAFGSKDGAAAFPIIPETICPVGYILARGGPTLVSTWTFGVSNNSAVTGMTWTFVPVAWLPSKGVYLTD